MLSTVFSLQFLKSFQQSLLVNIVLIFFLSFGSFSFCCIFRSIFANRIVFHTAILRTHAIWVRFIEILAINTYIPRWLFLAIQISGIRYVFFTVIGYVLLRGYSLILLYVISLRFILVIAIIARYLRFLHWRHFLHQRSHRHSISLIPKGFLNALNRSFFYRNRHFYRLGLTSSSLAAARVFYWLLFYVCLFLFLFYLYTFWSD